jgi:hypothetical protein
MILPEELINDIKYYTVNHYYCKPFKYHVVFENPNSNYREITIVFKKWWKRKLVLRFTDTIYATEKNGTKNVRLEMNEECLELLNQLKIHVAADNGYKVDEPKIKVNNEL